MSLPILETVIQAVQKEVPDLRRVAFVCVQHLLHTSIDVFSALICLGAKPQSIFLLGKHYSTSLEVVEKALTLGIQVQKLTPLKLLGKYESTFNQDIADMWQTVRQHVHYNQRIDTIAVLDDGGRCLKAIPEDLDKSYRIVGVEQTTAGISHLESFNFAMPYIDVATSEAKSLEADMVAEVIINKAAYLLPSPDDNKTCGIIGLGFIGSAIARKLVSEGYKVYLYDSNAKINSKLISKPNPTLGNLSMSTQSNPYAENVVNTTRKVLPQDTNEFLDLWKINNTIIGSMEWTPDLETLIQSSDYIFGCTGIDTTKSLDLKNVLNRDKCFISCSSEDKEFLSILKYIQQNNIATRWNPLEDVYCKINENSVVHIVKGGFPFNFDDSGTSVPAKNIQLTRALILCGLIQAIICLPSYKRNGIRGRIMLDPTLQRFVVSKWYELTQYNKHYRLFPTQRLEMFKNLNWIAKNSGGRLFKLPSFSNCFTLNEASIAETDTLPSATAM